jgi:hypothetical protein
MIGRWGAWGVHGEYWANVSVCRTLLHLVSHYIFDRGTRGVFFHPWPHTTLCDRIAASRLGGGILGTIWGYTLRGTCLSHLISLLLSFWVPNRGFLLLFFHEGNFNITHCAVHLFNGKMKQLNHFPVSTPVHSAASDSRETRSRL